MTSLYYVIFIFYLSTTINSNYILLIKKAILFYICLCVILYINNKGAYYYYIYTYILKKKKKRRGATVLFVRCSWKIQSVRNKQTKKGLDHMTMQQLPPPPPLSVLSFRDLNSMYSSPSAVNCWYSFNTLESSSHILSSGKNNPISGV